MRLPNWCRLSLKPDEIIGEHKMLRWWVIPPMKRFAIYVHKHQGDDSRDPHDHPADNLSIRLLGPLLEYTPNPWNDELVLSSTIEGPDGEIVFFKRSRIDGTYTRPAETARLLPRFRFRRAEQVHRLERINERSCWTLWIRFRYRRKWGFFTPSGWEEAAFIRQNRVDAND